MRLASRGVPDGTLIRAETQEEGRGRRGRGWYSPIGGLWFSVILRPESTELPVSLLPLAAGISVARTLRRLFRLEATLKWPNDVTIRGRKVAGVLSEASTNASGHWVVIGFGVNVNNPVDCLALELRAEATSIVDEIGSNVNVDWLMREILRDFASVYSKVLRGDSSAVIAEWRTLSDMLGQHIIVQEGERSFAAVAVDLDPEGALIVETQDGTVCRLLSADVSVRKAER
jgi:BirA family biotin operon repressor/biotin-[acetyl-CoA-carboxylase] ligase